MKLSSLFRKTLLGQTLLFGLVVGSLSLTSAFSLRWYLAGEYTSRGSAIARGVAGVSRQALDNQSLELLPQLLNEFKGLQGVAYVFVTSPEGELLAHTFTQEIPDNFQRPNFNPSQRAASPPSQPRFNRLTHSPNFEDGQGQVSVEYMTIAQVGYVINLSFPIQGGDLGYVYVGMDQVRMIQQIRAAASIQLWVMLGLFILSIVATYVMVQRISHPLNRLTTYARNLSERNFSAPLAIHSQDEIGLLAATMQTMANDIQRFIQQLESALDELQNTQTQLIQSEKMSSLGQLVAGVAHEINNPVSFIACNINYAENYAHTLMTLIERHQSAGDGRSLNLDSHAEESDLEEVDLEFVIQDFPKVLGSMRLGSERIRSIVQSLRNFSRLDESDVKAVDIHDGIDSTLMILNSRLKGDLHQAPIQVVKAYGKVPPVECYAGQLNQVFMNILSNAIDALGEAPLPQGKTPTITITTRCTHHQACIEIQDNGGGMPPAVKAHLFDPFFTTKPVGKGTGLGLSISYQIVAEHHQGQLTCDSVPGHGTTFYIKVPLKQGVGVASAPLALPQTVA